MRSTWACFDHISFIKTQNHAPFFFWIPYSSRNILSNFQNFLSWLNWLASGSTGSSSQLVWSSDFCGFGAKILLGSSL